MPKRVAKKQKAGDPADFSFLDMEFSGRGANPSNTLSPQKPFCAPASDGMMLWPMQIPQPCTKNDPASHRPL